MHIYVFSVASFYHLNLQKYIQLNFLLVKFAGLANWADSSTPLEALSEKVRLVFFYLHFPIN